MSFEIESRPAPDGVRPLCPHCRQAMDHVLEVPLGTAPAKASFFFVKLGARALMCPHCRVWLGPVA